MPVEPIDVLEGTQVFIGAPGQPMAPALSDALAGAVAHVPQVREAHLPQIYIEDRTPTAEQMLVVVLDDVNDPDTMQSLGTAVSGVLPPAFNLVIWPLSAGDPILSAVRDANCQIAGPRPQSRLVRRPWWQFWR
jgi:hypothetical protein